MNFKRRTPEVNFMMWVVLLIASPLFFAYDIGVGIFVLIISLLCVYIFAKDIKEIKNKNSKNEEDNNEKLNWVDILFFCCFPPSIIFYLLIKAYEKKK